MALAPARSSVIALSLLPFPAPRAGLAPFAARNKRAGLAPFAARNKRAGLAPFAARNKRAGLAPFAVRQEAATAEVSHCFRPCCHFRHRARGLPRSRQDKRQRRPKSVIAFALLPFPSLQSEPREQNGGEQERDHRRRDRGAFAEVAGEDRALI